MYHDNKSTQVDNDDTLDDYPGISDLGDGRILITWSSADRVLNDGATRTTTPTKNSKVRQTRKSTKKTGTGSVSLM